MPKIYAYANHDDPQRPGLGNLMFPWARSVVWARRNKVDQIAPLWGKIKIGPLLRRETDLRYYRSKFVPGDSISGKARRQILRRLPFIAEADAERFLEDGRPGIVEFFRMSGFFEPLHGYADLVRAELRKIVRKPFQPQIQPEPFIAMHVRLGDFVVARTETSRAPQRTDIGYFIDALTGVRGVLGSDFPALVFSNGRDHELRPLLIERNVQRAVSSPAITDMLRMAQGRVIIASSNSTFNQWATYLGENVTIYPRGGRIPPWGDAKSWFIQGNSYNALREFEWNENIDGPIAVEIRKEK